MSSISRDIRDREMQAKNANEHQDADDIRIERVKTRKIVIPQSMALDEAAKWLAKVMILIVAGVSGIAGVILVKLVNNYLTSTLSSN